MKNKLKEEAFEEHILGGKRPQTAGLGELGPNSP